MSSFPYAVFTSSDDGRHWLDAITTGLHPPSADGVPRTRNEVNGEVLGVAELAPGTLFLLTGCVPCGQPKHPDGTLGLEISTDDGRHWSEFANSERPLPYLGGGDDLGAIGFTTPTHGTILAQSATNLQQLTLIETDDRGRTWRRIGSFPP
jgi:hypothetical protein